MQDKGYTKAFFQAAGRIAKKGEEFNAADCLVGHNQGMLARGIRYGIIEKVSSGRYKMLVDEPWRAYKAATVQIRNGPRGPRGKRKFVPAVINGSSGTGKPAPLVRIVPYGEYDLIMVDKRIFLATEVQLTPRRQHG